jgi:CDP-diacylglycerol--glycerol-3-phosphate 3-phosphatidyltransferase
MAGRRFYRQIPNALTVARFAMVPAFVVLMVEASGGHSWPAGTLFGVAGVTDQVDGILARRWHVQSEFGKYADPLADRLMIDAAVLLLFLAGRLPWAALLVLARDVALIGGYKLVVPRGYELSVSFLGKLATWILYASIGFVLATHKGAQWPLWIFWIGFGIAVAAGALYLASAWKQVRRA